MKTVAQTAEMSEYRAVVASGIFPPGSNAAHFFDYVCQQHFQGNTAVTEHSIAVEALGRRGDFDPKIDAIVRVEAHRVRKRLHEYYEREGVAHHLRLTIPAGTYLPIFESVNPKSTSNQTLPSPSVDVSTSPVMQTRELPQLRAFALLGAVLLLLAGLVVLAGIRNRRAESHVQNGGPGAFSLPTQTGVESGVRIACGRTGSDIVDRLGRTWFADRYFSGGSVVSDSYRKIIRTESPALFLTRREGGSFSYNIPLDRGYYELRLFFAETQYGPDNPGGGGESSRMMTVTANGKRLLTSFDPLSDAGGDNTADERVFEGLSPAGDGKLHLVFSETWPNKANAFVNAIALVPNQSKVMQPIRWVASGSSVVDSQSHLWQPAQFHFGGLLRENDQDVTGTNNPALFRSSRFGNFSYAIPVPEGTYTLTLYFDEYWFGMPSRTDAIGSRLFDVYCNGTTLLNDYDIYKSAGGSYIAVTKTFHGLKPNPQGKLLLSFVPVRDYATLAALEVVSQNSH
jgi:Malectin domain